MVEGDFNPRTLANMNVALDRVCERISMGEQHDVRKRVAQGILQCAKNGRTTLGALKKPARRLWHVSPRRNIRSPHEASSRRGDQLARSRTIRAVSKPLQLVRSRTDQPSLA